METRRDRDGTGNLVNEAQMKKCSHSELGAKAFDSERLCIIPKIQYCEFSQ